MDFRRLLREERRRAKENAEAEAQAPANAETRQPERQETAADAWVPGLPLRCWAQRLPLDLEPFRKGAIPSIYYVPDWISQEEEAAVLERVYAVPDNDSAIWVQLKHRRLQKWGGEVKTPFAPESLPSWLLQIGQSLVDAGVFSPEHTPNHVLINEYGVGDGIMPHEDGPSYFPFVAIVSSGARSRVTFQPHRVLMSNATETEAANALDQHHFSLWLERRSLLLFTQEAYTKHLHSIDQVQDGTRISLTIRHVF